MAQTIQQYHDAIMAGPQAAQAQRLLQRVTSGTTSRWEAQRLLYFGRHLALVAWDFGHKDVVVIAAPKSASEVERAALHHFGLNLLPKRISPSDLAAALVRLGKADAEWQPITAALAAEARKATLAKQQDAEQRRWVQAQVTDALAVLLAQAEKDGLLYHGAFKGLARLAPGTLQAQAGDRKVTINVSVE